MVSKVRRLPILVRVFGIQLTGFLGGAALAKLWCLVTYGEALWKGSLGAPFAMALGAFTGWVLSMLVAMWVMCRDG